MGRRGAECAVFPYLFDYRDRERRSLDRIGADAELVEKDDDDYLLLMNNYFLKTMANINENPKVAIFVWSPEVTACFQMKGDVIEIADSGKEYEDFIGRVKAVKPQLPGKHMVVVRITDVFNCKSGETAGQKIL